MNKEQNKIADWVLEQLYPNKALPPKSHARRIILSAIEKAYDSGYEDGAKDQRAGDRAAKSCDEAWHGGFRRSRDVEQSRAATAHASEEYPRGVKYCKPTDNK